MANPVVTSSFKHQLRALFRSLSLLVLVAIFAFLGSNEEDQQEPKDDRHRRLDDMDVPSCDDIEKADPKWTLVLYIAGVLYMFLALAIVCDEFFVPALEEMSSERHLDLSMDVAGATLMAAGGSAPELFTALFGTFKESAVGFGTIVGSAVFNVLFVIGMCSLLSLELLQLTWWPLIRDSTYYVISLGVLAYFIGVYSPGQVELWEAIVLLCMYGGYVLLMAKNEALYTRLTGKTIGEENDNNNNNSANDFVMIEDGGSQRQQSRDVGSFRQGQSFRRGQFWNGTFRAGIVQLMADPKKWSTTAGIGMVARIKGDVEAVFKHVDKDRSNTVNKEEFRHVLNDLECYLNDAEFEELFNELDTDKNGMISKDEFTKWYVTSEKRMISKAEQTFDEIDKDKSQTIERSEVRSLLQKMNPNVTEEEVTIALEEMDQTGNAETISRKEFTHWYVNSFVYQKEMEEAEAESEGIFASVRPPKSDKSAGRGGSGGGGCWGFIKYIIYLPIVLTLACTIPDVRRPGRGKYCYLSFFLAIAWIGVYSYFMVDWAEIIGATLGIPDIIMGLTFLAAGTSVPDLLSSVIVARMGEGDMAVSSSIGSNIFDILIGLPFPWLCYTLYPAKPDTVTVGADGVGISIMILLGMIILIIVTIHLNGWKLTKTAGVMMFFFYFLYVVQAIWRELPFQTCV